MIYNVVNPSNNLINTPYSLNVSFDSTTGNKNITIGLLALTTGKLQSCSVQFNPSMTNTISTAIITIKTSNPVIGGILRILIPSFWNNSLNLL